jgi:hypothetical protein
MTFRTVAVGYGLPLIAALLITVPLMVWDGMPLWAALSVIGAMLAGAGLADLIMWEVSKP